MFTFFGPDKKRELNQLRPIESTIIFTINDPLEESDESSANGSMIIQLKAKSKLGWICWKDTEPSLYRLFETVFDAQSMTLNFTDSLEDFRLQVQIPLNQVSRFNKLIYSRTFLSQIDKIHGIEPILRKKGDVKLSILSRKSSITEDIQKESQETIKETSESHVKHVKYTEEIHKRDSLYAIQYRIDNLIKCQESRHLELLAIHEQVDALERETQNKLYDFQRRMHEKTYEACYKKFENIQKSIMETVNADLEILKA